MPEYKLGKNPARHDPRTLQYARYRTGNATPPRRAHWGHDLPYAVLGNDQYGDCVEAGYAHLLQIWDDRTGHDFAPTEQDALGAYTAITGFNRNDPSTDKGTNVLDAVKYWKSTGMAGQTITAYASVNPLDQAQVSESIAWFGGLYIGIQLPISAQSQVGEEWTVTTGKDAQPGSWGGHCVPLSGYSPGRIWCVTWGKLQSMSWDFLTTYCDEAYVLLGQEWLAASGESPSNLAWGQLMADLNNL